MAPTAMEIETPVCSRSGCDGSCWFACRARLYMAYDAGEQALSGGCRIDGRVGGVKTLSNKCNRDVTWMSRGRGLLVGADHP